MIGRTVSHYKILEKLGEGGMGVVYRAEDTKLERTVALKFLAPQAVGGDDDRARLVREAKAAAALNHPSICMIYEIEDGEGQSFIAMEYVEGENLKDRMDSGPIPIDEALDIATQVAEGLHEAHRMGTVHRDIKPANIMLTANNKVKIMDFGLAKSGRLAKLTRTGTIIGTMAYMSPEQVQALDVDHRSDLYSLGMVLYEMIAGRLPSAEDYEAAIVYSIVHGQPDPLSQHCCDVPHELECIVSKCLSKRPEGRHQSAADLANDLRNLSRVAPAAVTPLPPARRKMLAVLPFENLGPAEEEYFADGMTEEITSRLAGVRGLGVISRTSAMQYKGTRKSIREIGADLRVGYVLEGTIRWNRGSKGAGRVRITPQLIRVSDDTHIWSERYDRVIDDIFTIQSDIAEKVIKQLHVTLLEPERRVLEAKPTENLDAYQAYLRGIDFAGRPDYAADDFRLAIQMFERAVKLDPAFALAHAELSMAHSSMYFHGHDRTEGRLSEAKKAVDRAFELRADLPEGHLALGLYYYRGHNDWDRALAEFAAAENDLPNDTRLLAVVAAIKKRQGHMEAAVEHFKKAYEWSPRDAGLPHEIGCAYMTMRNYSEAERYYDRSISLAPDQILAYICKAWNYWLWRGDVKSARTTLEAMPKRFQSTLVHKSDSTFECVLQELYVRDYRAALDVLSAASVVFDEGQWWFTPKAQFEAHSYELIGDQERAFSSYDAARGLLEREVERRPKDDRVHSALGIAYAGLGRTEDAIREGRLGVELVPVSKNAVIGPFRLENLALIYTMVGELDLALDQIECLLSIPAWFSVSLLRIDPRWDPLREHPRFQSLLERHSPAGS